MSDKELQKLEKAAVTRATAVILAARHIAQEVLGDEAACDNDVIGTIAEEIIDVDQEGIEEYRALLTNAAQGAKAAFGTEAPTAAQVFLMIDTAEECFSILTGEDEDDEEQEEEERPKKRAKSR